VHLVGSIIRIYHNAHSSECQAVKFCEFIFALLKLRYRPAQRSMDRYHSLSNCGEREPGEWKGGFCCGRVRRLTGWCGTHTLHSLHNYNEIKNDEKSKNFGRSAADVRQSQCGWQLCPSSVTKFETNVVFITTTLLHTYPDRVSDRRAA